jgi:hypothetical protein
MDGGPSLITLERVDYVVRTAARWNRNKSWEQEIELVTTNPLELKYGGIPHAAESKYLRTAYGITFTHNGVIGIWLRPGADQDDALDTTIHEWAHAICAQGTSHDVSWRRLYGLSVHWWMAMYPDQPIPGTYKDALPCRAFRRATWRYTEQWVNGRETRWQYQKRIMQEHVRLCDSASKMLKQLGLPDTKEHLTSP